MTRLRRWLTVANLTLVPFVVAALWALIGGRP